MNKLFKKIVIVALIAIMAITLTGCGNKLVATKTTEETSLTGKTMKYEEKMQISFKKDKVNNVKVEYKFETDEDAKTMKEAFDFIKSFAGDLGMDIKQSGKKLTMSLDKNAFEQMEGATEEELTKDAIKTKLEADGYKVK